MLNLNIGDIVTLNIGKIVHGGHFIARHNNQVVFVRHGISGEIAKQTTDNFFENVIVNDENLDIKKNRLELLQMFCKTYNNFIDFSKVEGA